MRQRTPSFLSILLALPTCAVFLAGCSSSLNNDEAVIKAMEESLTISNTVINMSSRQILYSLENKVQEPITKYKALNWQPKALQIQQKTTGMYDYLQALKIETRIDTKKANELFLKLKEYKDKVIATDTALYFEFSKRIVLTTKLFDSSGFDETEFYQTFFANKSKEETTAILTKFQNNIKVIENGLLMFCNEQIMSHEHTFDYSSAIVGQSTTHARPGEKIEISAGIGAFSIKGNPIVTIGGSGVPLNESGFALYSFKASNKPGNHAIPVVIEYSDLDGKRISRQIAVEYTIVNPCDQ